MGSHHEEANRRAGALDVVCAPFRKCSQCWILHPLRLPPTLPKGWFVAMSLPLARQPPRRAPRRASSRARASATEARAVRRSGCPSSRAARSRHTPTPLVEAVPCEARSLPSAPVPAALGPSCLGRPGRPHHHASSPGTWAVTILAAAGYRKAPNAAGSRHPAAGCKAISPELTKRCRA